MADGPLFPKKLPDMPKAGWKKDFDAFQLKDNRKANAPPKEKKPVSKKPEKKESLDKPKKVPKPLKRTPLKPRTKPIAQIGKKRKERIENEGSEVDVFLDIWNTRPHWCEHCGEIIKKAKEPFRWIENAKGENVQKLIRPECFAHKLAKGLYPAHRLKPDNIALVCSRDCHKGIDVEY